MWLGKSLPATSDAGDRVVLDLIAAAFVVCFVPRVDGSELARKILTSRRLTELPSRHPTNSRHHAGRHRRLLSGTF